MANDPSSAYGAGFSVDVGSPYSFSDVLLGNDGAEPLFVDRVSLDRSRGLSIVGIRIGTVRTRDYPSGADGFPPASFHFTMAAPSDVPIPPKGAFDQPHTLLIVGLSAERTGSPPPQGSRSRTTRQQEGPLHHNDPLRDRVLCPEGPLGTATFQGRLRSPHAGSPSLAVIRSRSTSHLPVHDPSRRQVKETTQSPTRRRPPARRPRSTAAKATTKSPEPHDDDHPPRPLRGPRAARYAAGR